MSKPKRRKYRAIQETRFEQPVRLPAPALKVAVAPKRTIFYVVKLLGLGITVLGVLSSLYTSFAGPPWPTEPAFSASNSSTSPFDLPFLVTNKSGVFGISNLKIVCDVLDAEFKSASSDVRMTSTYVTSSNVNSTIERLASRPYKCPLRKIVAIDDQDAVDLVVKATVRFSSEYDSLIPGRRTVSTSEPFTLNFDGTLKQWVQGEPLR